VDGGGTKTSAVILDDRGRVRAEAYGPPSLHSAVGWVGAVAAVRATVSRAERRAHLSRPQYAGACVALAGVDTAGEERVATRHFRRAFGRRVGRLTVVNDTLAALRAGTDTKRAAVVVAGTGSNAFARGLRSTAFAGGLGPLLGDDGGGYWIGRAGLRAVAKAADGRGRKTALTRALLRHFSVRDVRTLASRLSGAGTAKRVVSLASVIVDRAAQRGDPVARRILLEAASRLAAMAVAAARRAGLGRSPFPLVASGGAFRAFGLRRSFRSILRRSLPGARVEILRTPPAVGAARLAIETSAP
jgi:N-acetylglucosamine kinase-like BadF-type ATPase